MRRIHHISFYLFLLLICGVQQVFAQYMDVTSLHGINNVCEYTEYGNGISFYDFNKDGWDDLTLGNGSDSILFYQNNLGAYELTTWSFPLDAEMNVQAIIWVDFDNDGDSDLLTSQYGGPLQLWQNNGDFDFEDISESAGLQPGDWDWWGASFADYDHDGFLDLYAAKYYVQPGNTDPLKQGVLYHNNGDGTFTDVTTVSGVELITQAIFQPVWFDFDHDGWEDLFLVIDRLIWPNRLFKNNHDGTFTDVSESSGLGNLMNSMSGTIGDFDNDEDFDVYVTNTTPNNFLFQNNGDETYNIITEEAGLLVQLNSWGACWMDCQNDGLEDIFVGTTGFLLGAQQNKFYLNNGNATFTLANNTVGLAGDFSPSFVCAIGDVDNDGYFDFATNNNDPFPTVLWQNQNEGNHYLGVTLKGVIANKDGIGSWISCYTTDQVKSRFTHCGENMMGQNSSKEIFGLGSSSVVDSLRIEWNSGTVDVYYNLEVDQHLYFVEGESFCIGQPCTCPADFTWDYFVSTADLLIFLSEYGCESGCTVDLNGDGTTNVADLLLFLSAHGSPCDY